MAMLMIEAKSKQQIEDLRKCEAYIHPSADLVVLFLEDLKHNFYVNLRPDEARALAKSLLESYCLLLTNIAQRPKEEKQ